MIRHAALPILIVALASMGRLTADVPAPASVLKEQPLKHLAPGPLDLSRKDSTVSSGPHTRDARATFFNLHTHEILPTWVEHELPPERLESFLRCRATGRTTDMATRPAQVALDIAERFEAERIHVVSGYRSEKFNEALRKKGRGVAIRSRHIRGEALDFRIPGVDAAEIARTAATLHAGGIGTYRDSNFVHVDVGPDRRWRGR